RTVMGGRSWTELFFLDEATALAAGHRPCFFCRRSAAEQFRAAWASGNRTDVPSAPTMDAVLHGERLVGRRQGVHVLTVPLEQLPDGAMVAAGDRALLIKSGQAFQWSPGGYERPTDLPKIDGLLTPPSTLGALKARYQPALHPSCAT